MQQTDASDGQLIYDRRKWHAIILIEVESMALATAKASYPCRLEAGTKVLGRHDQQYEADHFKRLQQKIENGDFVGTITYKTRISLTKISRQMFLDLGHPGDVTELWINGKLAGTRWYGIYRYDIASIVNLGTNDIEIKLTTVLAHYTHSLKDNKAAWERSQDEVLTPIGLREDISLLQG